MVEIPDFASEAPVPSELVESYRGRVPDTLVDIWERYGFGTWGEGFIRVIDPRAYEQALADCIGKVTGERVAIPIMVTGLGDLITWEPGLGVTAILYRQGRVTGLGNTLDTFVKLVVLDGAEDLEDSFDWDPFPAAVEAHGPLAFDESFIHVPLLSLGGTRTADGVQKRDTITGIQIMVEFQGVIEH